MRGVGLRRRDFGKGSKSCSTEASDLSTSGIHSLRSISSRVRLSENRPRRLRSSWLLRHALSTAPQSLVTVKSADSRFISSNVKFLSSTARGFNDFRARMVMAGDGVSDHHLVDALLGLLAWQFGRLDSRCLPCSQTARLVRDGGLSSGPALERATGAAGRKSVRGDRGQQPGDADQGPG